MIQLLTLYIHIATTPGANASAIEQQINTLHPQYTKSVFSAGSGHSLSGSSTSTTAQPVASAQPVRRNPWADKAFAEKMVKKAAEPSAAPTTNTTSNNSTTGNDSILFVDNALLKQLTDMGFPSVRAEKALHHTNNKDIESAMNWCLAHENDADIDAPNNITASTNTSTSDSTTSSATSASATTTAATKTKKSDLPADWDDVCNNILILYLLNDMTGINCTLIVLFIDG